MMTHIGLRLEEKKEVMMKEVYDEARKRIFAHVPGFYYGAYNRNGGIILIDKQKVYFYPRPGSDSILPVAVEDLHNVLVRGFIAPPENSLAAAKANTKLSNMSPFQLFEKMFGDSREKETQMSSAIAHIMENHGRAVETIKALSELSARDLDLYYLKSRQLLVKFILNSSMPANGVSSFQGLCGIWVTTTAYEEEKNPQYRAIMDKAPEQNDKINHPKHCHPSGVECITIARHHNFNVGSVLKYIWREGLKEGESSLDDLRKAAFYLNDEIERVKASQSTGCIQLSGDLDGERKQK